ncbi:hypothetical protein ACO0QE_000201 [Hanseniaspora vineae]
MNQLTLHKQLAPNSKVAVLGAGLSGLTFAYFLNRLRPDVQLTIFEQKPRSGGWINTEHVKFENMAHPVKLEKGPRTLRGVSDGTCMLMDIMVNLGCKQEIMCIDSKSSANRKFILDKSKNLLQVPPTTPASFLRFLTNPLSNGIFMGILKEAFTPQKKASAGDESVYDFLKRRFGTASIADNLLSAVFHGIYAGNVQKLSADYTLKSLVNMEKEHGSIVKAILFKMQKSNEKVQGETKLSEVLQKYALSTSNDISQLQKLLKLYPMVGFENGLSTVPTAIEKHLTAQKNVSFQYNSNIASVEAKPLSKQKLIVNGKPLQFDHLHASTVPTNLKVSDDLTKFLKTITEVNVALVNIYHPKKDLLGSSIHGFGYLVPKAVNNPQHLLGVIFDSVIENNFSPLYSKQQVEKSTLNYTKITAMLGGHYYNNQIIPSEKIIIQQVKDCLAQHLHISEQDLNECEFQFTLAKNSIPEYYVGYNSVPIERKVAELGVSLGGMKFASGPGLPDCVAKSFEVAHSLS